MASMKSSSLKRSSSHLFLCQQISSLVILFPLLLSSEFTTAKVMENMTFPALFAFGDSMVDQGNNNHILTVVRSNFQFQTYGTDFLGGMSTGRFTNGKTPADIIAEEFRIKEHIPAYLDPNLEDEDLLTGVSFASGGTGLDPLTAKTLLVLSMPKQLELFKEYIEKLEAMVGEEGTTDILHNSLYLVVVGSNDLLFTYFIIGLRRFHYDIDSYTNFLVELASEFLEGLYKLGARRIAVHGISALGCLPLARIYGGGKMRICAENFNEAAQMFNRKLSSAVKSIRSRLRDTRGSTVFFVNLYDPLLDIIQNQNKYGFAAADKGCCIFCNKLSGACANRSAYLFWDAAHPTERGYRVLLGKVFQTYVDNFQRPLDSVSE